MVKNRRPGFGAGEHTVEFLNFAQTTIYFWPVAGEMKNTIEIVDYAANKYCRRLSIRPPCVLLPPLVLHPDANVCSSTRKKYRLRSVQSGKLVWQVQY